jgi:hypothetical protein
MLICHECGCKPNQQLVCKECYEKKMMQLGIEIRSLQSEILGLRATAGLLEGIAKAGVRKFRESKNPPDSASGTEDV